MRSLLKWILKDVYLTVKRIFIRLAIFFIKRLRPTLFLTYDAKNVKDGLGAQLHRIISLTLVAFCFDLRIVQPWIEEITIHPLDPIQDTSTLKKYLTYWNIRLFSSDAYVKQKSDLMDYRIKDLQSLNLRNLLLLSIKSKFSKKPILVYTREAHSISDFCAEEFRGAIRFYFIEFLNFVMSQQNSDELIVHYRQGSGGFAIHDGQSISRQMPIESIISAIDRVPSSLMKSIKKLRLFTDSPKHSFKYFPVQSQIHLWKNMPGFDGKSVTNESSGIELRLIPVASAKNLLFSVERELDAFQMIVAMARSQVLVISRSSLSYVGGLFNFCGEVYFPVGFWHPKLKDWKTYN